MDTNGQKAHGLRREMARVRRAVHEDVVEIIESTRTVLDWRHYVRKFPGVASLAAATLGYLLVPHKRHQQAAAVPAAESPAPVAARSAKTITKPIRQAASSVSRASAGGGLFGIGLGILKSVAIRQAISIATRQIEKLIESASNHQPPDVESDQQARDEYAARTM